MGNSAAFERLDTEDVAALLGVSTKQVRNYINQKGLPAHGEGTRRTFVWSEVREWYVPYRVSIDRNLGSGGSETGGSSTGTSGRGVPDIKQSEARDAAARAEMRENQLAERQGKLVPIAEVSRVQQDVFKGLQTEILALSTRIAPQIGTFKTDAERFDYLTIEAKGLCTRLSQLHIERPEPDDGDPEPEDDE